MNWPIKKPSDMLSFISIFCKKANGDTTLPNMKIDKK